MDARLNVLRLIRAAAIATIGFAMVCGLLILFSSMALPVAAAPLAAGPTVITEDITINTTWTVTDSPYIVSTDTVAIRSGATLTVEPGVEVRFAGGGNMGIRDGGILEAIGTAANPITFTANSATPDRGFWDGISFDTNAADSTIQYALIEYAQWGVSLNQVDRYYNVSSNTFRYIGDYDSDPTDSGAIIGVPDGSDFNFNTIYSSEVGIRFNKAFNNDFSGNHIYDVDGYCIGLVRGTESTGGGNNRFVDNHIHDCGGNGLRLEGSGVSGNQLVNNVITNTASEGIYISAQSSPVLNGNTLFDTALSTTSGYGGVGTDQAAMALINVQAPTIFNNYLHDNGGAGGVYQGAAYVIISGTSTSLTLYDNRILDDSGSGLIVAGDTPFFQGLDSNAICVDNPPYELENRTVGLLNAEGNWFGTNLPLLGTHITGTVDFDPWIRLTLTPASSSILADGTSTTDIAINFSDGLGHVVPPPARDISVTTSAGTLSADTVTVDGTGQATLVLTSTNTPGTATVTATDWCGYITTTTVTFAGYVDLGVSKAASPPPYPPGSFITYTISYINNGTALASGVVLTETLPANTTFVGPTGPSGWFTAGPNYTYSVGSVAPGASGIVTFVVRITDTLPPGSASFTNQVWIGDDGAFGPDYNPADNVATLTVSGGNLPDLWVVKNDNVGPGALSKLAVGALAKMEAGPRILQAIHTLGSFSAQAVPQGGLITYTIGYGNSSQGTVPATGVVLSETLPLYTTYAGPACGQPYGWCQLDATRTYTYFVGNLDIGEGYPIDFVVRVNSSLPSTLTQVINTVCIDGNEDDLLPGNNCSSEQTPVITTTSNFDLGVTKNDDVVCAIPGRPLNYRIGVTNYGPGDASDVRLRELVPSNTTFQGPPTWGSLGGGVYTYTLGNMPGGATASAQFTVLVNPVILPGTTAITNVVSLEGTDANPFNNSATLVTPLSFGPDLVIAKNDHVTTSVEPGDTITYTMMVVNYGVATATNVVVTETLPDGTNFLGPSGPGNWNQVGTTNQYTRALGDLGPGQASPELVFQVQVISPFLYGDTVVNVVRVAAAETECDTTNNISTEETPVLGGAAGADLSVSKTDDVPFCTVPGANIGYTIVYTNHSSFTASEGVMLTEVIPTPYVTFQGPTGTGGWSGAGNTWTHSVGDVPTDTTRSITFNVQIAPTLPPAVTAITNVVRIDATTVDPVASNNVFTLYTQVPLVPDLVVIKNDNVGMMSLETQGLLGQLLGVAGLRNTIQTMLAQANIRTMAESVDPGDVISYTIIYGNVGRAPANGVVITETLPAGTTFDGPVGLWNQVGTSNTYTYVVGDLAAMEGDYVQFRVRVDNPFLAGDRVLNNVDIGGNPAECNLANNSSTEETPVTGAGPGPGPGGQAVYLPIILRNYTGPWASLAWVDQSTDRVSLADAGAGLIADGRADGRWTLVVFPGSAGPKRITQLVLRSSQGPGVIWDTLPGNPYSVIGVYSGSTLLNPGNGSFSQEISGQTTGTLYTSDTNPFTLFPPDRYDYTITVTFDDGTSVFATARIPPAPPSPPTSPVPGEDSHVADLVVDPESHYVYVASPRDDAVHFIHVSHVNTYTHEYYNDIYVSNGPTGLGVFPRAGLNSRVFVAHAFDWELGLRAFEVPSGPAGLIGPDNGYVGAAPFKVAVNPSLSRAYVSNYFDRLGVIDAAGEMRVSMNDGWVGQKNYIGGWGLDVSQDTNRIYLATRGTGELVAFDGSGDRLLQSGYIPTHFKPPQPCALYTVAVNEHTNHIFVPCPERKELYVHAESEMEILITQEMGTLELREDGWVRVMAPGDVNWHTEPLPSSLSNYAGVWGIAVDEATDLVYITDPVNDLLLVVQDAASTEDIHVAGVVSHSSFDEPQGVDVDSERGRAFVANAGNDLVTVLEATSPFTVVTTIDLGGP